MKRFLKYSFGLVALAWLFAGNYFLKSLIKEGAYFEYQDQVRKLNKYTVYITPSGQRYHRRYHYRGRNEAIGLGDALASGFRGCKVCRPMNVKFNMYKESTQTVMTRLGLWFIILLLLAFAWRIIHLRNLRLKSLSLNRKK